MKCVICSSINKKKNIKYFYKHLKKKYFKCFNCEFVFQYPLPTNSELTKYYNKSYFEKNYYIKNKEYNLRNKQYILDKKILLKYFDDKKNKKIFDYGCGNGEFLKKFKSKKFGYEFNKNAKVSNKIKILKLNEIKGKTFDLIIMRGVIEHITNFDEIIKKLSKSLKKNGLFYITATPNTNNLTFFLSPKNFNQNDFGHIYHFNNVNLSLFFLQNNFLNIETNYQYSETPYSKHNSDFNYLKKQLSNFKKNGNKNTVSPASAGNMMTMIFKKIA